MHKFYMPIGDWSGDGHDKCEKFLISSNKSVEAVREVHYRIKEVTGIDIHKVCGEYEKHCVTDEDAAKLTELGFSLADNFDDIGDDEHSEWYGVPEGMVELWMFLLMKVDPELQLRNADKDEEIPMLPFYGYDEKKRHIGFVGYGLYD